MTFSDPLLPLKEHFQHVLRTALNGLYDPAILRSSPLMEWMGLAQQRDPVGSLRRLLIDGIESLQPSAQTPLGSKTWRSYQILRRRYTEQRMQREVADDLGLSIRQMQREEKVARELLGDFLWKVHRLSERPAPDSLPDMREAPDEHEEEAAEPDGLEALAHSVPAQISDIRALLNDALATLAPVLAAAGVAIQPDLGSESALATVRAPLLRQALLNVLNAAAGQSPGGPLALRVEPGRLRITLHMTRILQGSSPSNDQDDSLHMAAQLVRLCGGSLALSITPERFSAEIYLPVTGAVRVLVVDDHADTLQLYQRYLTDSPYQMSSALNARQAIEMIETARPQAILLDVMMPGVDGWTLLGQMRVHPALQGVPILICSIIPQERLALSLGAAEFLRKPVSRADLLAALDRQVSRPAKESG